MGEACTDLSADRIAALLKRAPCVKLENGNVRTCPVRLSYPNLFAPQQRKKGSVDTNKKPKFGTSLLFPVGADLSVLKAEAQAVASAKWANAGKAGGPKLRSPFLRQVEDWDGDGYVEGGIFLRAYSERRPPVVDMRMVPILEEENGIYPGVWALVTLRAFDYDVENKGVTFGLQSVMKVCDDQSIGGGSGGDPNADFAGVDLGADFNPGDAFGEDEPDAASLF